jgi:hypothetical protein
MAKLNRGLVIMKKWKTGGDYEPCPEGLHAAVVVGVYDIGTQSTAYGDRAQVVFDFELAEEDSAGHRYFKKLLLTRSLHPKSKTRAFIESILGRALTSAEAAGELDDKLLLGAKCGVEIKHLEKEGRVYANITNVARLAKGMKPPKSKTPPRYLLLDREDFDREVLDSLPEWLQDKITSSPEYAEMLKPPPPPLPPKPSVHEELDDEVPF